jgi:Ca2+-binding RTX toxin-like protein
MVATTFYIPTNMNAWGSSMPSGTPTITLATATQIQGTLGAYKLTMFGNYSYNAFGQLTGGTISGINLSYLNSPQYVVSGFSINIADLVNNPSKYTDAFMYAGNDIFTGSYGADVLSGYAGNDKLNGGAGNDILIGGLGNDTLAGGSGIDWAYYNTATAGVTANLGVTAAQNTGGAGIDTLSAVENLLGSNYNDTLTGNASVNTLSGGAGIDRLSGGGGSDVLIGGAGKDTLTGGAGNDIFDFNAIAESVRGVNRDVITDFVRGADKIDLSTIDANAAVAGNNAFTFTTGSAFTAAGQVKFANGILYGNTDGNLATAEFEIALTGVTTLNASNFVL